MPQFEKRQAIQMAKDLVTLGLSDLDTDPCAPVYAPEPVERACRDVVNSLCQCLQYNGELNGEILQKGIEWLTELHTDVNDELRKEHELACDHVKNWIALLEEGIMQHHHYSDGSLDGGLVDLTTMTSAHLGLRELMQEMEEVSSEKFTLQQSQMLQTGNTVVKNMGTVTQAVARFHILPTVLNDIIRELSSEEEQAAGTSKAVAKMLSVSHSCKITAVLAHAALTTQVASASVTEIHLCELHLAWQTVLTRLQSVFSRTYDLGSSNPEVLIDAIRCVRLLDAVLREVINDVIIQDVCSAAQKNEDQDSMAVELLLVGLDAVERVSGLPNDIVGICRCLISKFAAACGDHIASILDHDIHQRQPAARCTPPKIARNPTACSECPKPASVDSLSEMSETSENDLFQVHWPPTEGTITDMQSPQVAVNTSAHALSRSKGKHASDEDFSQSQLFSVTPDARSSNDGKIDTAEWPNDSNVFWMLMQHWVVQGLKSEVSGLTQISLSERGDENSPPAPVEDFVEMAVKGCIDLLRTVDSSLSPCFPPRTGWDVLDNAFAVVQARLREIIFWAAQDDAMQWTFKGALQDLEADLQVCIFALKDMDLQGYPKLKTLCAWVLKAGIGCFLVHMYESSPDEITDGATLKEDFMVVESQGSHATLPECIELLRMMHEQVELARGVDCWPLLQLVSIGCHASCTTLYERIHEMCKPRDVQPKDDSSRILAHPGGMASFNALSNPSTPIKDWNPLFLQSSPAPGTPAQSPGFGASQKLRPYGFVTYFIAATGSKPESKACPEAAKARIHEHEFPVQFMVALANTTQDIARECQNTGERIHSMPVGRNATAAPRQGLSLRGPAIMTQDQKDACAAAHSQAEEWNRLAQDFLHTSKVCVSNILELLFDDIAWVLQRLFTSHWLTDMRSSSQEGGLATVLATCSDYISEVRGLAVHNILLSFLHPLLRHLVCCIAARMLLSELPFDAAWQKATTEELRRLHAFVATDTPEFAEFTVEYLNMLSHYRACLSAPDEFTATSSYKQLIRFGDLGVEWVDAAWKQDARQTNERKSDFSQSACRKCEEIVKESKLTETQVTTVKKYAFKWKAPTFKSTATSPRIRAHHGVPTTPHTEGAKDMTKLLEPDLEGLNPYVVTLAQDVDGTIPGRPMDD